MTFEYTQAVLNEDGMYGPNSTGHKYKPAPYHGVNAKRRADKSRWDHPSSAEYYVFNLADEHDEDLDEDGRMKNDVAFFQKFSLLLLHIGLK